MARSWLLAYFLSVSLASWAMLTQPTTPSPPRHEARSQPVFASHLDQLASNLKRYAVNL